MGTQTWLRFVRGFCVLAVAKNFSDSGNFEKHLGKMKANKTPSIFLLHRFQPAIFIMSMELIVMLSRHSSLHIQTCHSSPSCLGPCG